MRFESRTLKILVVLLIIVPLVISSVVFLWQEPQPKPGPAGADRFQNYNPLTPNYPIPPNATPPPELANYLNRVIGYADRPDIFLRLWSGSSYSSSNNIRITHYTSPTGIPSNVLPEYAEWVGISRNVTLSRIIGEALGIPTLVPSNILAPMNLTVVDGAELSTDPAGELYPNAEGMISYYLGIENITLIGRSEYSYPLSTARAFISSHARMLEEMPRNTNAENIASVLRLPDTASIYEQVGVVLAYMYSHVRLSDTNLTNPLDSLVVGEANYQDRVTTFVVLLRLTGVPANVIYGFIPENVTEGGMYVIKVADMRLFVEVYDMNTRIFFDPRTITRLSLTLEGKYYPINVYPVEVNASIVSLEGGDIEGSPVPFFNVNSTDYSNYLTAIVRGEVMGQPLRNCYVNVTRVNIDINETVATYSFTSNNTGYVNVTIEITYDNAVPGRNLLYVSFNMRVFTIVPFFIKTISTISPMSHSIYIYVPESRRGS